MPEDRREPGRVSDRCGWIGMQGDGCPVCGEPTRTTPDVIDEMAASVLDTGGSVEKRPSRHGPRPSGGR